MARSVPEIVEEQLARWRAERSSTAGEFRASARPPAKVVAISRELGTEAGLIGTLVSEILHLPLYDHEIIEHIARTAHVYLETIQTLDEHAQGRVEEFVGGLLRERGFDRTDYLLLLARTVISLWEHGPCVLVGHGSVHLVPREHSLKVRLIAASALREEQLAREERLARHEAILRLAQRDSEQAVFHRRFFGENPADPHHYHIVLDSGELGAMACAQMVADGYRIRFPPRAISR